MLYFQVIGKTSRMGSVGKALRVFLNVLCILRCANSDLSYSIQEELKLGSIVGNIAKDLGFSVAILSARHARIETEERRYCEVNLRSGDLIVSERIDREEQCAEKQSCVLKFDILLESPLELHRCNSSLRRCDCESRF